MLSRKHRVRSMFQLENKVNTFHTDTASKVAKFLTVKNGICHFNPSSECVKTE
jgi:hypothetical protein